MPKRIAQLARRGLDFLLDLLFPDAVTCLCCGRALGVDAQDGVCPACVMALEALEAQQSGRVQHEPLAEGIESLSAVYPYAGQARELILRLKFDGVRAAAVPLGRAMAMLPGGQADLLVPVPTTRRRLRKRGFNHAQLLCEQIAKETGMPMACALHRQDDHEAQSRMRGQSRRENIRGCMQADAQVRGQRVILVDDVYTTGATAGEAARALLEAGAAGVSVFAAAQTIYDPLRKKRVRLPFDQPFEGRS